MVNYKKLYFRLFAAAADAVEALEAHRPEAARTILIDAQRQAEQTYLDGTEAVPERGQKVPLDFHD